MELTAEQQALVDTMSKSVMEKMSEVVDSRLKQQQEQEQQRQQELQKQQNSQQEQKVDPIVELLMPHIAPELQKLQFGVQVSQDYVDFYGSGDAEAVEYKGEVEKLFAERLKQGLPAIKRADLLSYIKGEELKKNPDKTYAKLDARKKADLAKAQAAQDTGGTGSLVNLNVKDLESLPTDKLLDLLGKTKIGQ